MEYNSTIYLKVPHANYTESFEKILWTHQLLSQNFTEKAEITEPLNETSGNRKKTNRIILQANKTQMQSFKKKIVH